MLNQRAAQERIEELRNEVLAKTSDLESGKIKDVNYFKKFIDKAEAEYDELATAIKTHKAACSWASASNSSEYHPPGMPTMKAVGGLGRSQPKWAPPSPLQASADELGQLFEAANHRAGGFQVQIGTKSMAGGDIHMKSPIVETGGGFSLPSTIMPNLQLGLPFEPDRLFSHFNGINMDGPSAAFLQHVSNTNPAAAVGEGSPKPDLGMVLSEQIVRPTKIAALASISMEALQDYESFAQWIPLEATRALINAETAEVVSGSGVAPHMLGILNVSGLLTRAMGTDTALDALQLAFNDLRTGPAFATADLVALHPTTWSAIRREKNTLGSYLLSPDPSTGQVESIFGVTVVVNTMVPAGTGIVFDTTQAVLAWTRLGLTMGVNQFGDTEWTNNLVSFRVEERVAIGVRRPAAVCTVTGLPAA